MTEGPLGGPRPFSKERIFLMITERGISGSFGITGPLGGPRPLAQQNPVTEEDVSECMQQEGAREFVNGLEESSQMNFSESQREEMKEAWCRGVLGASEELE